MAQEEKGRIAALAHLKLTQQCHEDKEFDIAHVFPVEIAAVPATLGIVAVVVVVAGHGTAGHMERTERAMMEEKVKGTVTMIHFSLREIPLSQLPVPLFPNLAAANKRKLQQQHLCSLVREFWTYACCCCCCCLRQ